MSTKDFSKKYANFYNELNSLFTDELVLTKRECIGLQQLSDVFEIEEDRAKNQVLFTGGSNVSVGAKHEVEKLAKRLGKKYELQLLFL